MTCEHKPGVCCPRCRPELWHPTDPLKYTVERLAAEIMEAKRRYYKGQPSGYTDQEFDALERMLKMWSPGHPALSFVGYDVDDG